MTDVPIRFTWRQQVRWLTAFDRSWGWEVMSASERAVVSHSPVVCASTAEIARVERVVDSDLRWRVDAPECGVWIGRVSIIKVVDA